VSARAPISVKQVARAVSKVRAMSEGEKVALAEEIFQQQPNLLASCLVQPRLGVAPESHAVLLHILLVCFQAMKESGHDWPLISEQDQDRQISRLAGQIKFSEDLRDPKLVHAAQEQYLTNHREAPLLAFVINECNVWLRHLAQRNAETESDKFVITAALNLVNCIADATHHGRG
jgi:hypothetical protein